MTHIRCVGKENIFLHTGGRERGHGTRPDILTFLARISDSITRGAGGAMCVCVCVCVCVCLFAPV